MKLFFHISPEEQLRRFEQRLHDPLRRWKLSYEDFRNRAKWDDYTAAIDEMFERTSTKAAPWTLIEAEDKRYGRIAALEKIVEVLGKDVSLDPPVLSDEVIEAALKHFDLQPEIVSSLRGRTE